jgi:LysR family hydrogen peroxide-inducible transcriptional activator
MRHAPYPVTLRQLQYALAVAETGSFRRAAERCHVAQPSLSAQLAEAERALGVRLFDRDRRRVLVTAAGEAVLERARRVLVEADDLLETARQRSDPLSGTLRVGVIPTVAPYLLPVVAPALRRAFPRLAVQWTEEKTAVLVGRVEAGELDAALAAEESDLGDLFVAPLAKDPFVLAVPPAHPLGRSGGAVAADALAGEKVLLLDDGHCLRAQALEVCSKAEAEELGFRATSLATLVQMVSAGAGVTLLPQLAVDAEARRSDLRLRPFRDPAPSRTLVLVWRKGAALDAALREVAETLRGALAPARTARRRS